MTIPKCSETGPSPITENIWICRREDGVLHVFNRRGAEPSSPAAADETEDSPLESIFDELIEELYNNLNNGNSNLDTLRVAFEVISEIARTDPDLALDKIEDIRSYAIESKSVDTQSNCDLFSEIITHVKDSNYSLDHANELAGQNGITIDPQDPLIGLSEKLYSTEVRTSFEAIEGLAPNQGLILIPPSGTAKEFRDLDSYINQLLIPSSEEE